MTSAQNFGYYGIMIWLPVYLQGKMGFSITRSGLWISATVAGGALGMWLFGYLADRIGRKPLFIAFQLGAAVMAFVYPQVTDANTLLLAGFVSGIFLSGMIGGYGALISETYPTLGRGTAQNVLFNFGRGNRRLWTIGSRATSRAVFVDGGTHLSRVRVDRRDGRHSFFDQREKRRTARRLMQLSLSLRGLA